MGISKRYKIYDWAGNDLSSYHGTFKTFDDAWSYIYGEMTDKLDQFLSKNEIFADSLQWNVKAIKAELASVIEALRKKI